MEDIALIILVMLIVWTFIVLLLMCGNREPTCVTAEDIELGKQASAE